MGWLETLEEIDKQEGQKDCFEIYDSTAMKHSMFINQVSMVVTM